MRLSAVARSAYRLASEHMLCYISSVAPASSLCQPHAARTFMKLLCTQQNPAVVLLADDHDPTLTAQPLWQELSAAFSWFDTLHLSSQRHVALLRWSDVAPTQEWFDAVLGSCISMYDEGRGRRHTFHDPDGFAFFRSMVDAAAEKVVENHSKNAAESRRSSLVRASAQCILQELPALLCGVMHRGVHHRLVAVPGLLPVELHALLDAVHTDKWMAFFRHELQTTGAPWALPSIMQLRPSLFKN